MIQVKVKVGRKEEKKVRKSEGERNNWSHNSCDWREELRFIHLSPSIKQLSPFSLTLPFSLSLSFSSSLLFFPHYFKEIIIIFFPFFPTLSLSIHTHMYSIPVDSWWIQFMIHYDLPSKHIFWCPEAVEKSDRLTNLSPSFFLSLSGNHELDQSQKISLSFSLSECLFPLIKSLPSF